MPDMFDFMGAAGGTKIPYFSQLVGRPVVIEPTAVEELVNDEGRTYERLTADVTFLEGDAINKRVGRQGLNPVDVTPVTPGQTMDGMWIDSAAIVRAAKRSLASAAPGHRPRPLFGVLKVEAVPGRAGMSRYVLEPPTAEQVASAGRWSAAREAGKFAPPPAPAESADPWA